MNSPAEEKTVEKLFAALKLMDERQEEIER